MRIARNVRTRVDRLERDEPQALTRRGALAEAVSGPDRPQARRCRQPDGARAALPDPAAWQLDVREMARVTAAGDPDPPRVSRPLAAAEGPLAALEMPMRAGAEPYAAVGIHPDEG